MVVGSPSRGFRSILAISLLIGPCASVSAQADDPRAEFSAAYAAYQAAIDAGDTDTALDAARRAYELGTAYFGRVNANTAALALNYGNLLITTDPDAAVEVLSEADRIYAELHGPDSLDRVETQLALAEAQRRYEDKHAAIDRAAAMYRSSAPDDKLGYADFLFTAGTMLAQAMPGSPEAKALLTEALDVLERELGESAGELIPTLIELGNLAAVPHAGSPEQLAYYRRAVEIGESSLDDVTAADIKLRIGLELVRQAGIAETVDYLDQARRVYERRLGARDSKTALASLALAEALFGNGDARRARAHADAALDFYESAQDRSNLLRAQRLLMAIHLHNGDEDLFNDALMEVGRLSEGFSLPENEVPVVKYAPVYPARAAAAKAGGYVIVEFTVDETGRVQVPIVVESYSDKGKGEWFHDAALEAVRKFRYIPRYVDGVPTATPGVRNRITFVID